MVDGRWALIVAQHLDFTFDCAEAVIRLIYEMLGFDAEGQLDPAAFIRQNAELAMSRVIPRLEAKETAAVDAGSRFVARGGSWKPTPALEREILRAALDETPCKRLTIRR